MREYKFKGYNKNNKNDGFKDLFQAKNLKNKSKNKQEIYFLLNFSSITKFFVFFCLTFI